MLATGDSFKSEVIFGKPQAWLYSIEWQKCGLPHCHLLLWLSAEHRITPDKIDDVIYAEIPDPSVDPELHQIVMSNMVHAWTLWLHQPNSPCMQDGRCSKQVDVLPSKNQVFCCKLNLLVYCFSMDCKGVT